MGELWRRLGKFIQSLWKKIFNKKDRIPQKWNQLTRENMQLGAGEIFLDGMSLGRVESITSISKDDIPDKVWKNLKSFFEDVEVNCQLIDISSQLNTPKNLANIYRTNLPKHYSCKMLILSIAANQESEYIAVDMSQYEERGLVHYIIGRTLSFQEIEEEYLSAANQEGCKIDESTLEWMREGAETDLVSMLYGAADLYYYEDTGEWDFD